MAANLAEIEARLWDAADDQQQYIDITNTPTPSPPDHSKPITD